MRNYILFVTYIFLITACSDSDINIPTKDHIGLSKTLIAVHSPLNGSILPRNKPFILNYEVLQGIKSSYVKIQVNDLAPVTVAKIKGEHHINGLPEGSHTILVSEYFSNGKPSGSQALIRITVK